MSWLYLILGGLWVALFACFLASGVWAYVMHRAHDGDQVRAAGYALIFGALCQPVGFACLLTVWYQ